MNIQSGITCFKSYVYVMNVPCLFTGVNNAKSNLITVLYMSVCEGGQFSTKLLSSYWCTRHNLTPLLWCHICFLELPCVRSVLLRDVVTD